MNFYVLSTHQFNLNANLKKIHNSGWRYHKRNYKRSRYFEQDSHNEGKSRDDIYDGGRGRVLLGVSALLLASRYEDVAPEEFLIDFDSEKVRVFQKGTFYPLFVFFRVIRIIILFIPVVLFSPLAYIHPKWFGRTWWSTLRFVLSNLGGCWIKLGQWASTRPDIFSQRLIERISTLCHDCPAHNYCASKRIIEKDFGKPLDEIFLDFEEDPVASGAIGQAHIATLLSGEKVIVKIVHPSVINNLGTDLAFMGFFANLLSYLTSDVVDYKFAFKEFSDNMTNQLDMRLEARNLFIFNENFKDDKQIFFPKVIKSLVSRNVLVETLEKGISVKEFMSMEPSSVTRSIAEIGIDAYLKMLLTHNFIHADLHPGNILVRKGQENMLELVFLDAGLITIFEDDDWRDFITLFKAIVNGDGRAGAELMISQAPGGCDISPEDREKFVQKMEGVYAGIRGTKMRNIYLSKILSDIFGLGREYHVRLKSNIATLVVGTAVLEGIGRQLNPDLDILQRSIPILIKKILW